MSRNSCSSLPGRGQRRVADVVLEVEVRVVDPQRAPGLQRRRRQPLPVARDEVQPAADVIEVVVERGRRPVEDEHRADVHVRRRSLLVQERGVDRGEAVEVLLASEPPQVTRRRRTASQKGTLPAMPWDFSTEPEFQRKLDWMRGFVRERIWPLETLIDELGWDGLTRAITPLQDAGQGAGPVGRPSRPRARRPGLRPGQARPDARDPRHQPDRAARVRQRRARLGQLGDPRARRDARAEGALPVPAARRRPEVRLQHDRARHGRLGPDAAEDRGGQGRRRLGDQRPQVVLLQRLDRRLPDRDGRHRPGRAARTSARRCSSSMPTRRA